MEGKTNNESVKTEIPNDIEIVNLGTEETETASARAAVEAMKNSGYFAPERKEVSGPIVPSVPPVSDLEANPMPSTAPIFEPNQLEDIEQPTNAAEAVAIAKAKAQGEIKRMVPPPIAPVENLASSAAEAVAMMNKKDDKEKTLGSSTRLSSSMYTDTVADDFAMEEQYPEWKAALDKINREAGIKISQIETGMRLQFDEVMNKSQHMIQDALSTLESEIASCEQCMRDAIKKAGSSTEEAVKSEHEKMIEIGNAEKEAMIAEYEKQIADLKAEHNQEIIKMKDNQLNSLEKMKQMYSEQLDEMKDTYEQKIKLLKGE